MQIDLQHYVGAIAPWDLSVVSNGVAYPVRPLTLGDLAILERFQQPQASLGPMIEFVRSLFADPAPDVSAWTLEALPIVLSAVITYFEELSKKNAATIERLTRAAAAAAAGPGPAGAASGA